MTHLISPFRASHHGKSLTLHCFCLPFTLCCRGGLETLFNYEKSISLRLDVPKDREDSTVTIAELADHLCNEVLTEKPELFMLHKSM